MTLFLRTLRRAKKCLGFMSLASLRLGGPLRLCEEPFLKFDFECFHTFSEIKDGGATA
jgi:hypothetical protein